MNVNIYKSKYMELAYDAARCAPEYIGGYKVGAVIVDQYGCFYWGCNQKKTHPKQKKFSKSEEKIYLHAEIDALIQLIVGRRLYKADGVNRAIYIYRIGISGRPLSALPCATCLGALKHYNINTVFHSGQKY